jgi:exonuclease SbcD
MRILHFSDLHIGVENYGSIDPESGLSTRLLDFLQTYDGIIDYAIQENVDLVLFAGDAYKSRDPSQTHQREFVRRIVRLTDANIPVFLLVGNHDLPAVSGRATALEIFPTLQVAKVTVADQLSTYTVDTKNGPLQVIALPWVRRSQFLSRDDTRNLTVEEITRRLEEALSRLLYREIQTLDPSIPTVLTAHASLNTAVTSSEQSMMLGHDPVLLQSTIMHPSIDYVALGHIHKHQILSSGHPMVVYSGSVQSVDFGEEGDTKGFCIIDLNPSKPQGQRLEHFQFVPSGARRFLTITSEIPAGTDDPNDFVLQSIAKHDVEGAVVRVVVKIPVEQETLLDESKIRDVLNSAHHVAPVVREVLRERRTRLTASVSETLSPIEVLERYLLDAKITPERTKLLLEFGKDLINEEELME